MSLVAFERFSHGVVVFSFNPKNDVQYHSVFLINVVLQLFNHSLAKLLHNRMHSHKYATRFGHCPLKETDRYDDGLGLASGHKIKQSPNNTPFGFNVWFVRFFFLIIQNFYPKQLKWVSWDRIVW